MSAMPVSSSGSRGAHRVAAERAARCASNSQRAGGAVDEREAVEQRRRADRPHHEVLQPGLERGAPVQMRGAQHVERDREQLEADEQRHQALRPGQHDHAGDRARAAASGTRHGRPARGAGERSDSSDASRAPPRRRASTIPSASVSTPSAPSRIGSRLPGSQIQIVSPIAVSSETAVSAGTITACDEARARAAPPSARSPSRRPTANSGDSSL